MLTHLTYTNQHTYIGNYVLVMKNVCLIDLDYNY